MGKKGLYEVQHIIKQKTEDGKRFFRVKWVGYPSSQNTWQPQQHICPTLITAFQKEQQVRLFKKNQSKIVHDRQNSQRDRFALKILQMKKDSVNKQVQFIVLVGNRKKRLDRHYLFTNHPNELAKFYLSQYIKKNNL